MKEGRKKNYCLNEECSKEIPYAHKYCCHECGVTVRKKHGAGFGKNDIKAKTRNEEMIDGALVSFDVEGSKRFMIELLHRIKCDWLVRGLYDDNDYMKLEVSTLKTSK